MVVHRLYKIMKRFHIVSVPHVFPAGGDEDQDRVGGLSAEDPGSFQSVRLLHQNIQKENVKMFHLLQKRFSAVKLADGTGEIPLPQQLFDLLGKHAALEHLVVAYGNGQHIRHLPFCKTVSYRDISAECARSFTFVVNGRIGDGNGCGASDYIEKGMLRIIPVKIRMTGGKENAVWGRTVINRGDFDIQKEYCKNILGIIY